VSPPVEDGGPVAVGLLPQRPVLLQLGGQQAAAVSLELVGRHAAQGFGKTLQEGLNARLQLCGPVGACAVSCRCMVQNLSRFSELCGVQ